MSKIQELLNSEDAILVFDVDGVLARIEYGEYNHFNLADDDWSQSIEDGDVYYPDDQAIPYMVDFIKNKNINNIYTCSKSFTPKEDELKIKFLTRVFNIKEDHIFFVRDNKEKVDVLFKIKELNKDYPDNHIAMIDDNLEVLNNIRNNSDFATIHVSSFM